MIQQNNATFTRRGGVGNEALVPWGQFRPCKLTPSFYCSMSSTSPAKRPPSSTPVFDARSIIEQNWRKEIQLTLE
jgi:hypothetical protein